MGVSEREDTEMTATTYTAEQIIAIGGREWIKGDKHRVYLNQDIWTALIGLEVEHYKSGTISSASLDGERISNSQAYKILAAIDAVWLDVTTGQIVISRYTTRPLADEVPGWIRAGIAKAVAALPADDEPTTPAGEADPAAETPAAAGPARIIAALRAAGHTARDIARMVGVSVSTIYRWARGICSPRPTNAAALAALA